jgi:Fe-S oxidoreductase
MAAGRIRRQPETFKDWIGRRPRQRGAANGRVKLWPDTFNNHFHPRTAIAATRTLERAGFQVEAPRVALCCRPLFDYGMLDELTELFPGQENAKRLSKQTYLLSEFLNARGYRYPKLNRRAVVHGHCHHKAVMKLDAGRRPARW